MTIADWAFIISVCSALVSLAGFVWNVWSKFIYPKPRVAVALRFMTMFSASEESDDAFLSKSENNAVALSATNMGPIAVTLFSAVATKGRRGWLRRRPVKMGTLNPLPHFPNYPGEFQITAGPFAGGLPKKVEVGDHFTAYFIPDHEELAKDEIDRVGFSDTFGRIHWSPKADLLEARKYIREACDKVGKKYK
jgi:hypothetical protein